MPSDSDHRSAKAKAYHKASQVLSICLEMIIPCCVGYWVDNRVGTLPILTLVGLALGMSLGIYGLVKLASSQAENLAAKKDESGDGKR